MYQKQVYKVDGPALRKWRTENGVGLNLLARTAGISAPFLSDLERELRQASPAVATKIMDAMDKALAQAVRDREVGCPAAT